MPTPPFSQDRRDWLSEISGLFSHQKSKSLKQTNSSSTINLNIGTPKAFDAVSTTSQDDASAKDQAMAYRPGRSR